MGADREHEGSEALVAQLRDALPGFTPLDRDVDLGEVRIELVGRSDDGRLVLVRRVERVDEVVVGELLDLLAAARTHAGLLARHLGTGTEEDGPSVVLVAEEVDDRSARRLAALDQAVQVLEVRRVTSERATSTFLVARGESPEAPGPAAVGERLTDLAPDDRRRVELLVDRLRRVDDELTLASTEEGFEWRWRGRPIAVLVLDAGVARMTVEGQEPRAIESDDAVESLVDQSIARWMRVMEEVEGLGAVEMRAQAGRVMWGE